MREGLAGRWKGGALVEVGRDLGNTLLPLGLSWLRCCLLWGGLGLGFGLRLGGGQARWAWCPATRGHRLARLDLVVVPDIRIAVLILVGFRGVQVRHSRFVLVLSTVLVDAGIPAVVAVDGLGHITALFPGK